MNNMEHGRVRKTQIVVVGGGAGGLELVRKLGAKYSRKTHDIILVDCNLTHVWKPLLHEVAAGSLDANMDEVGYGGHAVRWGYRFFHGRLETIDREKKQITTAPLMDDEGNEIISRHTIRYDYLVLAFGGVSNDFGVPGVREHSHFLEHRADADNFRQRLLNACLRINHLHSTGDSEAEVRICIIGGGATGVELAAELHNAASSLQTYGLEVFVQDKLKVVLLEAGPRILPGLDPELSHTAHRELEQLGVEVRTSAAVTGILPNRVETAGAEPLAADLIVWAAGVKGADGIQQMSDLELSRLDTFVVKPSLQTSQDDHIFALGDCAYCHLPGSERPVPPRAQSAHQMASLIFENLIRLQKDKPVKDFVYNDHGSLVSLSRFSAIGSLMGNLVGGRMAIEGRLARWAYQSLYRMHLIAIHGYMRGIALIVIGRVNQIVRPKFKLH
ncbi:NAD(P)/FAD-dependent oxidoreductase [Parasphingorhabdus sp. DH2-15]|uniref:NAD(P)/FAD-dependent oxidoreductase n=1 Tax=Parasphingorhabdus sp. DH2-15 TaxID=3444112 RepID=UPI003F6872B6